MILICGEKGRRGKERKKIGLGKKHKLFLFVYSLYWVQNCENLFRGNL
jgi:hypothetical protein